MNEAVHNKQLLTYFLTKFYSHFFSIYMNSVNWLLCPAEEKPVHDISLAPLFPHSQVWPVTQLMCSPKQKVIYKTKCQEEHSQNNKQNNL